MKELNEYQREIISRLNYEGRDLLAKRVYNGWLRGVNVQIPKQPVSAPAKIYIYGKIADKNLVKQ